MWFVIPIPSFPSLFATLPLKDSPYPGSTHFLAMDTNICLGSSFKYCQQGWHIDSITQGRIRHKPWGC